MALAVSRRRPLCPVHTGARVRVPTRVRATAAETRVRATTRVHATAADADHVAAVQAALADPSRQVWAQTAPAVRVAISEEFGLPPGFTSPGQLVASLRALGFDRVYDVALGADLTVMEEGHELIDRILAGGRGDTLPMMTSCCPGWVAYVEKSAPELIPHLSSCKSPHLMLARVLKAYVAPRDGLDPGAVTVVSVMPCVKKQGEADRPGNATAEGGRDVDHVLTTRDLGALLRDAGIQLPTLEPQPYDDALGAESGSGVLFGSTGGVMEAALRTVYEAATGEAMARLAYEPVRGLEGVRVTTVHLPLAADSPLASAVGQDGVLHLRAGVANGLANAKALLAKLKDGSIAPLLFVEVMACPGGCIGGGGQPRSADKGALAARQAVLYALDRAAPLRRAHDNPSVKAMYDDFLTAPLSPAAHAHLHTRYWEGGPPAGDAGGTPPSPPQLDPHLPPDSALADALAVQARALAEAGGGDEHVCEHCGAVVDGGGCEAK